MLLSFSYVFFHILFLNRNRGSGEGGIEQSSQGRLAKLFHKWNYIKVASNKGNIKYAVTQQKLIQKFKNKTHSLTLKIGIYKFSCRE